MSKLVTYDQLHAIVADWVKSNLIANNGAFIATKANVAGLLDRIGKQFTIDHPFNDKLAELEGESLPYGKTIEEFYEDLVAPMAYSDLTDDDILKPAYPNYRPVCYSYTQPRAVLKTTRPYDDLERAMTSEGEFNTLVNDITKKLQDSFAMTKYQVKKQLLGTMCDEAAREVKTANAVKFAASTAYEVNALVKKVDDSTINAIVMNKIESSSTLTYDDQIKAGNIQELDLVKTLAVPSDEATGEAFIEAIKTDVEKAGFPNSGHSLNGSFIGSSQGLYLIMLTGIEPVLDTKVLAGAFHTDKVAIPADTLKVDGFGTTTSKPFAILMDKRGARRFSSYMATRQFENAAKDNVTYWLHYEHTLFYSRNTFLRVYMAQ